MNSVQTTYKYSSKEYIWINYRDGNLCPVITTPTKTTKRTPRLIHESRRMVRIVESFFGFFPPISNQLLKLTKKHIVSLFVHYLWHIFVELIAWWKDCLGLIRVVHLFYFMLWFVIWNVIHIFQLSFNVETLNVLSNIPNHDLSLRYSCPFLIMYYHPVILYILYCGSSVSGIP